MLEDDELGSEQFDLLTDCGEMSCYVKSLLLSD